ncbi:peptidylprolyl isomerase [Elusimicrobiota bacterium]
MKNKILVLTAAVMVYSANNLPVMADKVVEKVIARVNKEVILLSEYNNRADQIIAEYEKLLTGPDKDKKMQELRSNILDQMIDEKLLVQKAEKEKVRITDAEVDQGMDEIRARFGTEVEFQNEISKQGMSGEAFRDNVSKQLRVIKLINMKVQSKIQPPTEDEIKQYYKEHEEEMVAPEQVRVRHILVKSQEESTDAAAKKKINEIYDKVKKDPDKFSSFAEQYSEGPSAAKGGDLGFFSRGDMVKEFEDTAFAMEVGQMSKPVKTRFGYHIIKLISKKASEKKTFSEVSDRLKNILYQVKMEKEYEAYLRSLRDEAKISKSLDNE